MDNVLLQVSTSGLERFTPEAPEERPVDERPTLSLHLDEGSPGYACMWYLIHHVQARTLVIRDIFHREWNDAKGALMDTNVWWVCLLTRIPFNMAYGP